MKYWLILSILSCAASALAAGQLAGAYGIFSWQVACGLLAAHGTGIGVGAVLHFYERDRVR